VVHFAAFLFDRVAPEKFGRPRQSTIGKIFIDLPRLAILFKAGQAFPRDLVITGKESTADDPVVGCILPEDKPPNPDESAELSVMFPEAQCCSIRTLSRVQTVADLIADLQPLTGKKGKEGPKIEKLQFDGEDLALDRQLGTIKTGAGHPIHVIYVNDKKAGKAEPQMLSPEREAKVQNVLELMGADVTRDDVIAALERNGWDENKAGNELVNANRPPPSPDPPTPAEIEAAEVNRLLQDLMRTYQELSPTEKQGIMSKLNGNGTSGVNLLTALQMWLADGESG
jgi:hypothetical protein